MRHKKTKELDEKGQELKIEERRQREKRGKKGGERGKDTSGNSMK